MGTSGYESGLVWYQSIGPKGGGEPSSEGAVADFSITSSDAATESNSRATSDEAVAAKSQSNGLTS